MREFVRNLSKAFDIEKSLKAQAAVVTHVEFVA